MVEDIAKAIWKLTGITGRYTNVMRAYKELKRQGASPMRTFVGVGVALFKDCGSDYVMGKITNGMTAYLKQLGFSENRAEYIGSSLGIIGGEGYDALKNQISNNK